MVNIAAQHPVATLADKQVYTRESIRSNPMHLFGSLLFMCRAREEVAIRVQRQRSTWVQKRRDAGVRKLSGKCPSWLKLNDARTEYEILWERAHAVIRMFEDLAAGMGRGAIARRLNEAGVPAFAHGRHWDMGTVSKVLTNDGVLGVYHPMRLEEYEEDGLRKTRRVPAMDPILGYYPRIVSDELWLKGRRHRGRGRSASR